MKIDIRNVGYRSVNCYLLITDKAKLLIDVGWPGGTPELKASLAKQRLSIKDVTHVIMTHYHIDHAGIGQEIKDKGAKLIVMESQKGHLNDLKQFLKPPMVFHDITDKDNIELGFDQSRAFLEKLGLQGEIIPTTGHGLDHVSLVLDNGIAFTGDLPPESGSEEGTDAYKDWKKMRSMNVKRIFPAHGNYDIEIETGQA
jgi:endoribonuclease LACTB2